MEVLTYQGKTYVSKGWRTAALILLALLLITSTIIIVIYAIAFEQTDNENACYYNVCAFNDAGESTSGFDGWNYDWISETCYCYKDDQTSQIFLG